MIKYEYSTLHADKYSPQLRRTFDDYGDARDTFRGVTNYYHHPNPSPGYWGYVMGINNKRLVGKARDAMAHDLLTLNHSSLKIKLRNVVDVYDFQIYTPRPRQEDIDYINEVDWMKGHSPYRLPFPSGYTGHRQYYVPPKCTRGSNAVWTEGLANTFRRIEKKKKDLAYLYSCMRTATGEYATVITGLAEKAPQWLHRIPLQRTGEFIRKTPRKSDVEPFFRQLSYKLDTVLYRGYGGHVPNVRYMLGQTAGIEHLRGLSELKRNYNSHDSINQNRILLNKEETIHAPQPNRCTQRIQAPSEEVLTQQQLSKMTPGAIALPPTDRAVNMSPPSERQATSRHPEAALSIVEPSRRARYHHIYRHQAIWAARLAKGEAWNEGGTMLGQAIGRSWRTQRQGARSQPPRGPAR